MGSEMKRIFMAVALAGTLAVCRLEADTIGIAVNGVCEAGNCANPIISFNAMDTTQVDVTLTLADGDTYLVDGSLTGTNNSNGGGFSTGHNFQVTYEGNGSGGASQADTITVEAFYEFETTVSPVTFDRDVVGAFGPTIASSSSASSCVNGTLGCVGPVTPPGSFGPTTSFPLSSSDDIFTFNPDFVNNFGAGSAVGSYIVWGQTAAIPAPTPEPAFYPAVFALGLAGTLIGRLRRSEIATNRESCASARETRR